MHPLFIIVEQQEHHRAAVAANVQQHATSSAQQQQHKYLLSRRVLIVFSRDRPYFHYILGSKYINIDRATIFSTPEKCACPLALSLSPLLPRQSKPHARHGRSIFVANDREVSNFLKRTVGFWGRAPQGAFVDAYCITRILLSLRAFVWGPCL